MTHTKVQTLFEVPAWYHALTLRERAISLHSQRAKLQSLSDAERAERRVQRWRAQKPFSHEEYFVQRLSQDNLTEDQFRQLVGEPIEEVYARTPMPPTWLTDFIQAYTQPSNSVGTPETVALLEQQETSALLVTIEPLLRQAYKRMRAGIDRLIQAYIQLPFDPNTIHNVLSAHLPQLLLQMVTRTLVLEVNVARLQGLLTGDTPQDRFQSFVERLQQPEHVIALFQEYPVLARALTLCVDRWVSTRLEFVERLCTDWEAIRTAFCVDDPGYLTEIDDSGDTHREGRAVIIATFSSNFRVVYKPRTMAVDRHFQELLLWVNERSGKTGTGPIFGSGQELFGTLRIVDRGDYGWMEYVAMEPCATSEEVQRFYYRQGSYLALLYGIAATDFHAENLIAAGEYPMLVDLETLFHPMVGNGYEGDVNSDILATEHMVSSVLSVGLLPQLSAGGKGAEGFEFSGLGGMGGQLTPLALPQLDLAGTDMMQVVHQRVELAGARNRPTLNGAEVNTSAYTNEIIQGFTDMYQLLLEHREDLLSANGPILRFANDEIRVILRPTMAYALLMRGSFHPDVLRNALDRDRFFDKLWEQVEHQPYLTRVIGAEHESLCRGDIPMFTSRPNSVDLWSDIGNHIPCFVKEPGLVSAQRRLCALSPDDLKWQQWYIRASMTMLTMVADQTQRHTYDLSKSQPTATRTQLLAAARALGDGLERLAWRGTDSASWIGMVEGKGQSSVLVRLGTDLYYGTPGIAIFLAHLGRVTNEARYTDLARAAVTTMRRQIGRREFNDTAIGAFEGWGGVIYALTHLSRLWDDPELLKEASDLIDLLPPLIAQDTTFDFMIGSAGCIASLLAFYRCTESQKALDVAIQCGEQLIAGALPQAQGIGWMSPIESSQPLTGFSHGVAGIAWSLLELASLTGQKRFRETALTALDYERSLFSSNAENWPDFRAMFVHNQAQDTTDHYSYFWCHGSAGIGLSRLASLQHLNDDKIHQEIRTAIEQTIQYGFGITHCLCHGDFGNLELLLQAGFQLNDSTLLTQAYQFAALILESAEEHGWLCGVPFNVETPGLMTGLAGIGYGLLRLAEPHAVPSLLLLELPEAGEVDSRQSTVHEELFEMSA